MSIIDKIWKGIQEKMKLTGSEESRLAKNQKDREERWMEIHDYWVTVREEPGAVPRCMEKFGCSKGTVMNAISFGLKFGKDGVWDKSKKH